MGEGGCIFTNELDRTDTNTIFIYNSKQQLCLSRKFSKLRACRFLLLLFFPIIWVWHKWDLICKYVHVRISFGLKLRHPRLHKCVFHSFGYCLFPLDVFHFLYGKLVSSLHWLKWSVLSTDVFSYHIHPEQGVAADGAGSLPSWSLSLACCPLDEVINWSPLCA